MYINPYIFREYDIRGRIDAADEMSPDIQYVLGRATGAFFARRGIGSAVVGHDSRPYSRDVAGNVVRGLIDSGVNVIEIGQVLAPIFYFSQYHLKQKGGVMITASHNPYGWTGLKIANDFSSTLLGDEIKEVQEIAEKEDFRTGAGEVKPYENIIEHYTKDILSRVAFKKPLRVLVDAGNGTAGPIVPAILRRAGHEVIERHCDLDPSFPNHEPNPSVLEAAEDIARGVKENGADIGFGFDDDGDRLGFADDKGTIVWPDKALIFLARAILEKSPGASIVFDVKCTQALIDDIVAHGGTPVMWKTGHSYIKQKSKELSAPLAGERSGHIFIRQGYYGFDDAVFAALRFLEYLSGTGKRFSELLAKLPQYITSPVWQPPCSDEKKYGVAARLTEELKKEFGPANVIDINGARVIFDDGWGLVRASSNLPVLVLVFESKTEEGLRRIESLFREKLAKYPEVGTEWSTG